MPEERTIYGAIKEKRDLWGIVFSGLAINEVVKIIIEDFIPVEPIFGYLGTAALVLIAWAASDMVNVERNEDARFLK